jgi:hypothetical protein
MNHGDMAIILSGEDKGEVVTIECALSGIGLCDSVVESFNHSFCVFNIMSYSSFN